jgi:hypothetical protein
MRAGTNPDQLRSPTFTVVPVTTAERISDSSFAL